MKPTADSSLGRGRTLFPLIIVLVLLAAGLLFFVWPTCLTVGYFEITLETLAIDTKTGEMSLTCDYSLAYGTQFLWEAPPTKSGSGSILVTYDNLPPRILRWPRHQRQYKTTLWVASEEE